MNIAPHFLNRVRRETPASADEFELLEAAIVTGWNIEHRPDGTHGTITASGPISERGRTVPMGTTIPIAYHPANFLSDAGTTWVVPNDNSFGRSPLLAYALIGTRMVLDFFIRGTMGGAGSDTVYMLLPDGWSSKREQLNTCQLFDNGAWGVGVVYSNGVNNQLAFSRSNFAALTLGSVWVQGQMMIDVGTS
jgi:hypothetical protein